MRSWLVVAVVLAALSSTALAQAPGQTEPQAPIAKPFKRKEAATAVLLSIGTTAGGFLALRASQGEGPLVPLGLAGMYFGPSTGQWYAGRFGGWGLAARAAGFAAMVHGFNLLTEYDGYDCLGLTDQECAEADAAADRTQSSGERWMWGGILLTGGSMLVDFYLAGRAANDWNREHSVSLAPTMIQARGGTAPGVTLQLTF